MSMRIDGSIRFKVLIMLAVVTACLGLCQNGKADTTTLTFDDLANGTIVTTQYQSLGATVTGGSVEVFNCASCAFFPPSSGTNVAFSPIGWATFSFDSTVIGGDVQSVSAILNDFTSPAGIYAFDSSNNLLGQAVMPSAGLLDYLSISSSSPIAYVQIQGGAGEFSFDDFTFTSSTVPEPSNLMLLGIGTLGFLGTMGRKLLR